MRWALLGWSLLFLAGGGCAPLDPEAPPEPTDAGIAEPARPQPVLINAEDHDQSCAVDDDCEVVPDGNVCGVCPCPSAAVHIDAAEDFYEDARRLFDAGCLPHIGVSCGDCERRLPECVDGVCRVAGLADEAADGGQE